MNIRDPRASGKAVRVFAGRLERCRVSFRYARQPGDNPATASQRGFRRAPSMPYNCGMTAIDNIPGVPRCATVSAAALPRACSLAIALLFCFALPAPAATVYRTVDDNGVVSYSDTPPADEVEVEILVIDIQTPELSESALQQLDAMRETTDRMVADRQQREKHRAEMRKLQLESEPRVIEYPVPATYDGIYTGYYPYPAYRPGYRPRPDHPITRPPLRPRPPARLPGDGIISPGHDYPASLVRRGYSPAVRAAFEQ